MDEGRYFCQHCNGLIESLKEAGYHKCFRGKQFIYQNEEDNTILFVERHGIENQEAHEDQVFNHEDSEAHNSSSSGSTANIQEDEELNDHVDCESEINAKKNIVWTKKATMAMITLYEANIQMLIA